jgi:ribonuclease P protein component
VSPHFVAIVGEQYHGVRESGAVLGVTVSRKVGTAVERNRVKRRIREWFHRNQSVFPDDAAVVVIARRGAASLGKLEIEEELEGLFS